MPEFVRGPAKRVALVAAVAAVALGGAAVWRLERAVRPNSRERGGLELASPPGRAALSARSGAPERPEAAPASELSNRLEGQGRELLRVSARAGVQAVPVRRMDIHRFVEATGSLVAAREQKLRFGVSGRVASVAVQEGQHVTAGSLLATLDDADQRLALVRARSEYESARLEGASAQVEEKRLALETAQRNLEATRLVAPFDGVIAQLDIRPGDQVTPSQQAAWIVDLGSLQAQVAVDEVDLAYVRPGQAVTVRPKTYPELELPGRVERVATAGRSQGDLVLFDVVVALQRLDPRLRQGMSVTARIEVERAQGVLAVPEEAVVEVGGRPVVTRVVGDEAVVTPVELGVSDGRFVQVRSGLQEGDRVLATSYAVWRGASGVQGSASASRSPNPFSFRLTPFGGPFPGAGGGPRGSGGH